MISSAYTYYLSTYGGQQVSKYDTHKRSELRSVYNNMLKVNKKSPLYKLLDTDNVQKYAIDLKESARSLKNVAASLTDMNGSISGFLRKKAVSGNTAIVEAKYIGEEETEDAEQLEIKVNALATSQVNEGNYLNPSSRNLPKGEYSFDMNIGEYTYEFSFSVRDDDDNSSIQDKLVRLFNRANIGVTAGKVTDENENQAIIMRSNSTGESGSSDGLVFSITENEKSDGKVVAALGLNNIKQRPSNANFSINGVEHTASSNTFSVKHQYQLTLKNVSLSDEAVKIGVKQDIDSILENVNELISSYNSMVDLAIGKAETVGGNDGSKLISDINNVAKYYKNNLESAGFKVENDGHITVEDSILIQSAGEGNLSESLEKLNAFKKAVVAKADDISIDPMKYVNKKLISYPHPLRNFTNPYVSSVYSGMMFNGYV